MYENCNCQSNQILEHQRQAETCYSPRQKSQATVTLFEGFFLIEGFVPVLGLAPSSSVVGLLGSFATGGLFAFFRSGTAPCVSIVACSANGLR